MAGVSTRNQNSWDSHYNDLQNKQAILTTITDKQTEALVGAALFHLNHDEANYSVAAYDRSLFDKPLAHVVQARTIEFLKELGVGWYRLGRRFLPNEKPQPTEKEVSIGYFIDGFASHWVPTFKITLEKKGEMIEV